MLIRLFVLGHLNWKPMSGYEIQQYLTLNQTEKWAGVLPGSIYHALKKLASEGLVTLQTTEQTGNRTRTIYAITSTGIEEFHRLLKEIWRTSILHFPIGIYAGLQFVDEIPREEVIAAIDEQITSLEKELATWQEGANIKAQYAPDHTINYIVALFDNGRRHIEIDLEFLKKLRDMLPNIPRHSLASFIPPLEEDHKHHD